MLLHKIIGYYSFAQLKEIMDILEVQERTDHPVNMVSEQYGNEGDYEITYDKEGAAIVRICKRQIPQRQFASYQKR